MKPEDLICMKTNDFSDKEIEIIKNNGYLINKNRYDSINLTYEAYNINGVEKKLRECFDCAEHLTNLIDKLEKVLIILKKEKELADKLKFLLAKVLFDKYNSEEKSYNVKDIEL